MTRCFVGAILTLFLFHHGNAMAWTGTCQPLFRSEQNPYSFSEDAEFVILERIEKPKRRIIPLLSRKTLNQILGPKETVSGQYGRTAVRFLADLPPSYTSARKAEIWNELAYYIRHNRGLFFSSEMFKIEGDRFLFRGSLGETLFIDSDGTIYRTKTDSLRDHWVIDYSILRKISKP